MIPLLQVPSVVFLAIDDIELSCGFMSNSVHSNREKVQSPLPLLTLLSPPATVSRRCSCPALLFLSPLPLPFYLPLVSSILCFAVSSFFCYDPHQLSADTVASESPTVVLTAAICRTSSRITRNLFSNSLTVGSRARGDVRAPLEIS